MYRLLSERKKKKTDVYKYDVFPTKFRNQIFYIFCDVIDPLDRGLMYYEEHNWDDIHDLFAREKGLKKLGYLAPTGSEYGKSNIEEYIEKASDLDFLDLMDFVLNIFDKWIRDCCPRDQYNYDSNKIVDDAIKEWNLRFEQNELGYECVNGEIIRIDNTVIHKEYIKPALMLFNESGFEGANDEFIDSFKKMKEQDYKNAIFQSEKAFESVLKTICSKCKYKYDKKKDTAKKLIKILKENDFFPKYMEEHLNFVAGSLSDGLPAMRNKKAGHGQGEKIEEVPRTYAEYAIGLAAVNSVFLINLLKDKK